MFPKKTIALIATLAGSISADAAGYVLPSGGSASTTQFIIGTEFGGGTSCGVNALPNGQASSGGQGGGPGYLYAAINQLAFGANPSVPGAGGPGAACGICYWLTPVSDAGIALSDNALIFQIVDECPAAVALSGSTHCTQCSTSQVNDYGQTWHFDIAVDAMSTAQYNKFFNGVTDGSNWRQVYFEQTACGAENPTPPTYDWGCMSGCSNNEAAGVCDNTGFSKS
ncbi:hypothetical protein F5Y08DRAFT_341365 [Xylaria arbuscula]|nr:hypothetical protein F5Y08DRAFT_341365 [Xylaria arbuscula]